MMPENVVWSQEWYIYSGLGSACVDAIQQKVAFFSNSWASSIANEDTTLIRLLPFWSEKMSNSLVCIPGRPEKNRILEQTTFDLY